MLRRLPATLPLALLLASPAAAQECQAIRLAPGASGGEVEGVAPSEGALCLALDLDERGRARVQILEGDNVQFGVDGAIKGQEDYAFVAEPGTRRIRVSQVARGAAPQPFAMRVSVDGTPAEAPGGWRLDEGEGRASGVAWLGPEGGASVVVGCAAGPEPRLSMTFDGIDAPGLAEEASAWIEIERAPEPRRHPVRLAYSDGFDPFWEVVEGLSRPLLDDLARGTTLRLLDARGAEAGEVGLAGSARLRGAIARRCGL